jgi:hypothetical protein
MKILITPEDIVKRCLWDNYVYYILESNKEAEKILLENKEIELTEKDAFVIGLLKVMETENLIHRFNMNVSEFLTNKSSIEKLDGESMVLVRKKPFDLMIEKYLDKFPQYWTPSLSYNHNLKELVKHLEQFKLELEKLEVEKIESQNFINEYYHLKSIKKMLRFNY